MRVCVGNGDYVLPAADPLHIEGRLDRKESADQDHDAEQEGHEGDDQLLLHDDEQRHEDQQDADDESVSASPSVRAHRRDEISQQVEQSHDRQGCRQNIAQDALHTLRTDDEHHAQGHVDQSDDER